MFIVVLFIIVKKCNGKYLKYASLGKWINKMGYTPLEFCLPIE